MPKKNILTRSKKQKAFALMQSNQLHEAKSLFEQISATDKHDAETWCALGAVNGMLGLYDESIRCCRQAIAIRPDDHKAYSNLTVALEAVGRLDEAVAAGQEAVRINPNDVDTHYNLGNALKSQGRLDEAIASYHKALRLNPDDAESRLNLGIALAAQGKLTEAIEHYQRALRIRPNYAEAYNSLGVALAALENHEQAIAAYRQALKIKPDYANAHNNLAIVLEAQGRLEEAVAGYREALRIRPNFAEACNNLGNALKGQGQLDEAVKSYREALRIKPDYPSAYSNLLLALNYSTDYDPAVCFTEHVRYHEAHDHNQAALPSYTNTNEPDKRLKVGYVSPDFQSHSVAFFIELILRHHDPAMVETFCYAEVKSPDSTTERLKGLAAHWRNTCGETDAQLAEMIHADEIDILVDLAGHTARNRLPVFALKPAPVQVTYLGYPNTTGLPTMDYRLTDALADPPGQEAFYSEKLIRLPQGFLCYTPPTESPEVGPLPASQTGHVTFGSFNMLPKINPSVVETWSRILKATPRSRLILKNKSFRDEAVRERYLAFFQKHGIAADRLELIGWLPRIADHLDLYHRIDIALDTFPYNGTTTTCEALWMGAPVITLAGDRHAGRVGVSLLTQIGLTDLIADTPEDYVNRAVQLAENPERVADLRSGLRERMVNSVLCDGKTFAQNLETAYREMWKRWCAGQK